MDWAGSWFACSGHYICAFPPSNNQITSKYKPIAPKPSPYNAMNPHLRFSSFKRSNGSERSNRKRRPASDFCNSPSPRGRKRTRVPSSPDYVGSKRNPVVETVPARIIVDRPKIEHPLDECFGVDKLSVVKDSEKSLCDKGSAVFGEEIQLNNVMDSMGKVVIQSPSRCMEFMPIQAIGGDPECGLGLPKCLVLHTDIQEDKNWRNLVTLPLLPDTSKDSDMGLCAPNSTSNSNASYDKEKFRLRIFGKDFSN